MKYKGSKLVILVCLAIALFFVGLMYITNSELTSFSKADTTNTRWMLGLFLGSVSLIFIVLGYKHRKRDFILLESWKLPKGFKDKKIVWSDKRFDVRFKHAFLYGSLFYGLVLIFGLGGGTFSIIGHYIFTILAAITTYLIVVRSSVGTQRMLYAIGLFGAGLVWILGFINISFTVFFGEFLFMIPTIIWVLSELKNVE